VQVLRLLETFDLEALHGAVKDALRLGAIGYDAVKHLVLCRIERRPPKLDLDIYPYLPRANVATTAPAYWPARRPAHTCLTFRANGQQKLSECGVCVLSGSSVEVRHHEPLILERFVKPLITTSPTPGLHPPPLRTCFCL
jgi:hypothetical protein